MENVLFFILRNASDAYGAAHYFTEENLGTYVSSHDFSFPANCLTDTQRFRYGIPLSSEIRAYAVKNLDRYNNEDGEIEAMFGYLVDDVYKHEEL
nr:MAG TPA: hypothetical protein [Microviridae sp.]